MDKNNKEQYNEEPVHYCKRCLSLNIKEMPLMPEQDYCGDCGTVDTGIASIEEWDEMYKKRYGHQYIIKKEYKWPYWC